MEKKLDLSKLEVESFKTFSEKELKGGSYSYNPYSACEVRGCDVF